LQKPQLYNDEKQEEALRPLGDEKVLQFVPQAHGAQGSEIAEIGFTLRPQSQWPQGESPKAGDSGESSNG
jgi:hypothetical protein